LHLLSFLIRHRFPFAHKRDQVNQPTEVFSPILSPTSHSEVIQRRHIYRRKYLDCCRDLLQKHESNFIRQINTRSDQVFIHGTNRPGESHIGTAKQLLQANPNTRAAILQAKIQLRQFPITEIERVMDLYWHIEDAHAAVERENFHQAQTSEDDDRTAIQKQLMKIMFIALGYMNEQDR
jgi:hypothetical protein